MMVRRFGVCLVFIWVGSGHPFTNINTIVNFINGPCGLSSLTEIVHKLF